MIIETRLNAGFGYAPPAGSARHSLREIVPPPFDDGATPSETPCPSCGGRMTHGPVPCPDGKPGCLVLHYGLRCGKCGKQWH